jgi:hypothetical protein
LEHLEGRHSSDASLKGDDAAHGHPHLGSACLPLPDQAATLKLTEFRSRSIPFLDTQPRSRCKTSRKGSAGDFTLIAKPADHAGRDELSELLRAVLERAVAELKSGWRLQYDVSRTEGDTLCPSGGVAAILMHAEFGVALVDVVPRIAPVDRPGTPADELRSRLSSGGLKQSLLRKLPIVHLSVTPERMDRLEEILSYAFSWEPPFTSASDTRWMERVAQIVSTAPSKSVQFKPSADPSSSGSAQMRQPFAGRARALRAAGWLLSPGRR